MASVFYWHQTELAGQGDLRPYAFVQLFPMLAIPVLLMVRPPVYTRTGLLWIALGLYVVAKVAELQDSVIFEVTGGVSGHTAKHLFAGLGAWCIFRMVQRRALVTRPEDREA